MFFEKMNIAHRRVQKLCALLMLTLVAILSGCDSPPPSTDNSRLQWLSYPARVTAGESFEVQAVYSTPNPGNNVIGLLFTVREAGTNLGVYHSEQTIADSTQTITFSGIILTDINDNLYFELQLSINGAAKETLSTKTKPSLAANWHTNIVTTYFNPGTATWGNNLANENTYYFALPYRDFHYYVWNPVTKQKEIKTQDYYGITNVKNRWIEIVYQGRHVYAQWEDVGPWNYYDPYYVFSTNDTRPYAEIGIDMGWSPSGYRETNLAGLDLSPTAITYLNNGTLIGKINTNWRFVAENEVPAGPWKNKISASDGEPWILNLNTETLRTSP